MNSLSAKFSKAYGNDALEMKVLASSPVEIVILLYEGAIAALAQVELAIDSGDISKKINRINKALDIIEGLRVSLNHDKGGQISTNLNDLYEYMKMRLSLANLKNDKPMIAEVKALLSDLLSAWVEIKDRQNQTGAPAPSGSDHGRA